MYRASSDVTQWGVDGNAKAYNTSVYYVAERMHKPQYTILHFLVATLTLRVFHIFGAPFKLLASR